MLKVLHARYLSTYLQAGELPHRTSYELYTVTNYCSYSPRRPRFLEPETTQYSRQHVSRPAQYSRYLYSSRSHSTRETCDLLKTCPLRNQGLHNVNGYATIAFTRC